nr:hypothetical protein [Klebsiella aerogenes]
MNKNNIDKNIGFTSLVNASKGRVSLPSVSIFKRNGSLRVATCIAQHPENIIIQYDFKFKVIRIKKDRVKGMRINKSGCIVQKHFIDMLTFDEHGIIKIPLELLDDGWYYGVLDRYI